MKKSQARVVAFWGMVLVLLFGYGCLSTQDWLDPQAPKSIEPHLKATGGQTINAPARPPQPPATVAIIKDNSLNYSSMVSQAVTAALGQGGIANLVHSGNTVLIKPNLVTNSANAVTDWHVVKALVDLIKTVNGVGTITIADGSASQETVSDVMVNQGYTAANFPGVTFANFNDSSASPTNTYVLADSRTGTPEQIPALITDADVYIDMPKMKTHYHAGMTGAVKNLGIGTGPLPLWTLSGGSAKAGLHHDIRSEIVDHIACRVPNLTVMDALQAMEGQGPVNGAMVTMNLVLASKDPVALDAVACNIMGIPPSLVTHLVFAANENIGVIDLSNITTAGNITLAAASAIHTFLRATPGAVQGPTEPGVIPYRETTVIRPAPAPMTIDGDLSEWGYANAMTIDASYQVKSASGWGGATDSSAVALSMYDAQNLYLAMHVKDNTKLVNNNTGSAIVNGDGVELYLSTYIEQYNVSRSAAYGSQYDYHLAISYADTPQAYMLSHSRALTGAVISKVDTSDGYVIEAKIPWSNFGSPTVTPVSMSGGFTEYRELGLNIAVNDADNSPATVDHKLIWNNATDGDIETNPIKTGMSYVDPAGGLYATPTYTLTTSATNGSVTKSPDRASYSANMVATLTAVANAGYVFAGWSGDAAGTANPLSVTMNGNKNITANFQVGGVLTSITVSPSSASVSTGQPRQFTAIAYDQNGAQISPQPTFTWSVSGGGSINASGLFTAGSTAGGPYTVTAQSGGVSGTASVTVSSTPTTVYQINTGSSAAASPFTADQYGSGGSQRTVTNTITITGVTNPAPMAVYQSERYGNSTYTLPNLTPGSQYTVRLHFAELYQTATGKRVFNVAINGATVLSNFDIYATAGGNYKALVREFTATADASGQIAIQLTTVTDNATIEGIEIVAANPNNPPTIVTAAVAAPNPVSGTTASLSVLGDDDAGEANLTYTWATIGTPPGAVTFGANGTNGAKSTTATFSKSGNYTLQVTARDQPGLTATSTVAVTVNQTLTSIVVAPASSTLGPLEMQQFVATAQDQFATALATQPTFAWSVSGGGTIDASGLFTAGTTAGGPYTVTAQSGVVSGTATVSVAIPNAAPTIATAAFADPNPATDNTVSLSVLGDDDAGEANLTYTWATTGAPPAAVAFSANGTNAAKNTTATFSEAGSYTFQVTVRDQGNLTATSSVAVTVNQTLTSIAVSPASATVNTSASQQFTAAARDQFGTNLTTQPTFTWSVAGGGTIGGSGLFTAGTSAGGPYTVTAQSAGMSGTASVTVSSTPTTVYQINTGSSSAASPFAADQYGSGGTQHTVTNTITISGITNPAPQAVYQSERYGNSTYTLPNLAPGSQYTVRLHFAELFQTAAGRRVFNVAINGTTVLSNFDIYATAGGNYKALVREFTAAANASGQIVIQFTTVTDNATIEGIEIISATPNNPPTIATAASATPNPVSGATASLSVLGDDDGGEGNLTYTWATTGTPPAAVTFSANGTNAAKNTSATFGQAGTYTFQVTVRDQAGLTATSAVAVTVDQTLTSIVVAPVSSTLEPLATQQFVATARDQFAADLASQPSFAWSVSGGGAIDASGLFTANTSAGGPYTVTAASGGITGTATVSVEIPNAAPTIATPAAASPSPVAGSATTLSALGDDDGGEANLTYTWATTGTPPAAVAFGANGTNAAKATTATFSKAGSYAFQVTVRDQGGLTATSSVAVTVDQTLTSIVVTPASATVNTSASQQFSAAARDQFGTALTTQPSFAWSVNGGGSIGSSGLFVAGASAGGPYTVTAASGGTSGTASVTVSSTPTAVYQINVGSSSAASPFAGDQYASGGTQRTVTNSITISGITNPAPMAVYQSERYGNSTYTFPSLIPGSQYTVRLHFAELYQTAAGRRVFNVAINGTTVLSNFDIYATVGARYAALLREFTATANTSGQIVVTFTTVTDNATIEGIEIIATTPNNPPSIATAATATPDPVVGTTAALSVLGTDDGGETNLTYTWATTGTPPAAVAFSANGTNAAKNATATFSKAGSYTFQVTVGDQGGLSATSSVAVTVNQTLTSIVVSPASASVNTSATQQFTASARDQFATSLSAQPTFAWTVSGGGSIGTGGLFTAGSSAGGPYTVSAQSGSITGTASVTVTQSNAAPTIATVASSNPNPVAGSTAAVSVLGADDGGEGNLTYTWATTGTPPAAVAFSANGTNAAKNATATFSKAGSYTFQVTVRDQGGLSATSSVAVTVNQTLTSIVVSPASASVNTSATQQFTATARDQFATSLSAQPTFTWTVSGGGSIGTGGLFTAGSSAGGPYTVSAQSGSITGTASVTVTQANTAPTIATAASSNPNPVAGTTAALSVVGTDDGGESNLTYTWATTGTPPAAVAFSANGTNAAKNATATFSKAGSYTFQVTVRDQGGLSATSSVAVTVNQTLTSIVVSPASASVNTSATQQFTATARDQFTTNLTSQPTFTWTVSGGGSISTGGLFTAGSTAGGPYTVTARSGSVSGTASVTVTGGSTPCAGLCSNPVVFTSQNYQSGNLGTGATCHQTTANLIGGNCSNIGSRTLKVNNTTMNCNGWTLPAKLNGGYCIQVTAGSPSYTSFATW